MVASKLSGQFGKAAALENWTGGEALGLNAQDEEGSFAKGPTNDQLKDLFIEPEESQTATAEKDDPTQYKGQSAMDMLVRRNNLTQPDPNANKPVDRQNQQALNDAKKVTGQNYYFTQAPKIGLAETGTEAKSIAKQGQEAKQVVAQMQKGQIALKQMESSGNNAAKPAPVTNTASQDSAGSGQGSLVTKGQQKSEVLASTSKEDNNNKESNSISSDNAYSSTQVVDTRQTQSQAFLNNMSKGVGFGNDDIAERSTIASMSLTDEDTKMTVKPDDAKTLQAQMKSIEIHAQEAGLGVDKYRSQGLAASVENYDRVKNPSAFAL